MRYLFKKVFSYDVKKLFRLLAENEKDELNHEIIALRSKLEEAYRRRDYLNDKLGYV